MKQANNNRSSDGRSGCELCDQVVMQLAMEEPVPQEMATACRQHMAVCSRCRALASMSAVLSEPPEVDEVDIAAAVAMVGQASRTPSRKWGLVAAAVATAAAVVGGLLFVRLRGGEHRSVPSSVPSIGQGQATLHVASGCLVRSWKRPDGRSSCLPVDAQLALGQMYETGAEGARFVYKDELAVLVGAGATLSVRKAEPRRTRIRLTQGLVALRVKPGRGNHVEVVTKLARVIVKGTIFAVRVAKQDVIVSVWRGRVAVVSTRGGSETMVSAGQAYSVSRGRNLSMADPDRLALAGLVGPGKQVSGPNGPDRSSGTGDRALALQKANRSRANAAAGRAPRHARGHTSDRRDGGGATLGPETTVPTALDLVRKAQTCRRQHKWSCALGQYRTLLREHRGSVVTTALVAMAEIELRHMGRPKAALTHFEQYLRRRPTGSVAAEALYGKARALRALGRRGSEIQSLRSFLKRYPNAILAARVRDRLRSLGALR
ncbi:MAG: FecR domain-containing protein [Deltaproteobacteria bacterium]|nr:FecR domain-containing protein [Deltaproteobacteria bacterium]